VSVMVPVPIGLLAWEIQSDGVAATGSALAINPRTGTASAGRQWGNWCPLSVAKQRAAPLQAAMAIGELSLSATI
jgi:hypothetical protein